MEYYSTVKTQNLETDRQMSEIRKIINLRDVTQTQKDNYDP